MSGPKISKAELERIRQEEEERRVLFQGLVRLRDELQRRKDEVMLSHAMLVPVFEKSDVDQHLHRLGELEKQIDQSLSTIENALAKGVNQEMRGVLDNLADTHSNDSQIIVDADKCGSQIRDEMLMQYLKQAGTTGHSSDQAIAISDEMVTFETQRLLSLLSVLESRAKKVKISVSDVRAIRKELKSVTEDTGRDNLSIYEAVHRIDVYKVRRIRNLIEKIEAENDALDQRLSDELAKYHVLCAEMGITPQKFPFRAESIAAIQYEIGKLIAERKEKSFDIRAVMKHIRESLSDCGYTYIGEKEDSLQIIREAYRIHDNVILHVVYDSSGRVTMEVAIEDQMDRLPHQREINQIVKEQEHFCQDYEEIFRRINENGLALRNVALYPSSPDFAEIVNTSAFICQGTEADRSYYDYYISRDKKYLEVNEP